MYGISYICIVAYVDDFNYNKCEKKSILVHFNNNKIIKVINQDQKM